MLVVRIFNTDVRNTTSSTILLWTTIYIISAMNTCSNYSTISFSIWSYTTKVRHQGLKHLWIYPWFVSFIYTAPSSRLYSCTNFSCITHWNGTNVSMKWFMFCTALFSPKNCYCSYLYRQHHWMNLSQSHAVASLLFLILEINIVSVLSSNEMEWAVGQYCLFFISSPHYW